MPGSDMKGKPMVKEWLESYPAIKTIVDLGPGAATYAKYVDIDTPQREDRPPYIWKAVEIWGPYIERYALNNYYSEIRMGDIRYVEFPEGDCCIAGDILEHLPREDFIKTFKKIDSQFKYVVLAIPINLLSTPEEFKENPFEKHVSYWDQDELDSIFVGYKKVVVDPCVYYFKAEVE